MLRIPVVSGLQVEYKASPAVVPTLLTCAALLFYNKTGGITITWNGESGTV